MMRSFDQYGEFFYFFKLSDDRFSSLCLNSLAISDRLIQSFVFSSMLTLSGERGEGGIFGEHHLGANESEKIYFTHIYIHTCMHVQYLDWIRERR